MGVEESLSRAVLFRSFQIKVGEYIRCQELIPFHIDQLSGRDPITRDWFRHIQMWYTQALNLSLEQVRECIHLVDLRELEGFSVEPIYRPFKIKQQRDGDGGDEENEGAMVIDTDNDYNDDNDTMWGDPESFITTEDDILNDLGFKTRSEYDAFIAMSVQSSTNAIVPSSTQGTECPQTGLVTTPYDENGFYTPGSEDIALPTMEPNESSWRMEGTEEAEQAGILEPPSWPYLDLEQSSSATQQSSNPDYQLEEQPLSPALRNILNEISADVDTRRTNTVVKLTPQETRHLKLQWAEQVAENERREASINGLGWGYEETNEETDILDKWDKKTTSITGRQRAFSSAD